MRIVAVIGNEQHSTSSGWSKLSVNGQRMSHREAISKRWLSQFGDKHSSWCECVFEVADSAEILWEAGSNSGNRGADRARQKRLYRADSSVEVIEIGGLGYPASEALLKGRLSLVRDLLAAGESEHDALASDL